MILSIIIIVVILWFLFGRKENRGLEGFWDVDWRGEIASDCYKLDGKKCMTYSNCGLCDGKCVPGDKDGAFFNEYCDSWKYTDYYDRDIFGESVERNVIPWSRRYGSYEQVWPSPQARATL